MEAQSPPQAWQIHGHGEAMGQFDQGLDGKGSLAVGERKPQ